MFSCSECGLVDHKLQVPARATVEEDVRGWMLKVQQWTFDEHKRVAPNCQSKAMANLKIPLKTKDGIEAEFVGQQIE